MAHHPLCGKFDDHMLNIRGRKVCRGCVTVYPATVIIFIVLLMIWPAFESAFIISLILFGIQLIRFFTTGRIRSIIFNLILGSSLGTVVFSAMVCPSDLRIYLYPFIITVIVSFEYLKGRKMLMQCKKCPSHGSFPRCARGQSVLRKENIGQ